MRNIVSKLPSTVSTSALDGRLHFTKRYGNTQFIVGYSLLQKLCWTNRPSRNAAVYSCNSSQTYYDALTQSIRTAFISLVPATGLWAYASEPLPACPQSARPQCVHWVWRNHRQLRLRVWASSCLSSISKTSVRPLSLAQSSPAKITRLSRASYPWCPRGRNNARVLLYFTFHLLYTNDHVNRLYKAKNAWLLSQR